MNPKISQAEQEPFTVDTIAMKRRIQAQIYEDTKGMTPEQFIAYMHKRIANSEFADFLQKSGSPAHHPLRKQ